jgi:hypothetical protein
VWIALVEPAVERHEGGEGIEAFAFAGDVGGEREAARGFLEPVLAVEVAEGEDEGEPFQPCNGFVFDKLGLVEFLDAGGEPRGGAEALSGGRGGEVFDGVDVEVEEVAVKDGRRQVGAGVVGLAVEDGVERIEGDVASAGVGGDPVDDAAKRGEVTASPGLGGTDAVEADGESGELAAGFEGGAEVGAAGADDEAGFGAEGAGLNV